MPRCSALWAVGLGLLATTAVGEYRGRAATGSLRRVHELTVTVLGTGTDAVSELRGELREEQNEDDTNEGIIERLLQKQAELKNTTEELQHEVAAKQAGATGHGASGGNSVSLLASPKAAALEQRIHSLHEELNAATQRANKTRRELAEVRKENDRLVAQLAGKSQEGRVLRKKLSKSKLALLQSMDEARETSSSESEGVLSATSDLQKLSKRMMAETKSVNAQLQVLQKKLSWAMQQERDEQGRLDQARAEVQQIRRNGGVLGWRARLATQKASAALQESLRSMREAEDVLRAPNDPAADAAAAKEYAVEEAGEKTREAQLDNARLLKADRDLRQKYSLLQSYYHQQQRQIDAYEGRLRPSSMQRQEIAMLEEHVSTQKEHASAATDEATGTSSAAATEDASSESTGGAAKDTSTDGEHATATMESNGMAGEGASSEVAEDAGAEGQQQLPAGPLSGKSSATSATRAEEVMDKILAESK